MKIAICELLLSFVYIVPVELQQLPVNLAPAADALCEAQGLRAARAGNRCIVKSIGKAGNYSTLTNSCPSVVGLKNGRLAFSYSRAIYDVLFVDPPLIPGTYTSSYASVWTALVQKSSGVEPAGGWSLQLANGSLIDVPSAAISWNVGFPNDIGASGTPPVDFAVLTSSGLHSDVDSFPLNPNRYHWVCEYEFVNKIPVVFDQIGAGFVLNSTLIYTQPTVDNDHQCANECAKAYICGSFGFNSATKQCSLYWIYDGHVNFAANQLPGDAYDTFWELTK